MAKVSWSGLYDGVYSTPHSLGTRGQNVKGRLGRMFRSYQGRKLGEIIQADFDSENKDLTMKRSKAKSGNDADLGGKVEMETVTILSGAVTAAEKTDIKDNIAKRPVAPATYPVNDDLTGSHPREGI